MSPSGDKANELQEQRAELEEEVRKCQAEQKAQQEEKTKELDTLKTELHRRGEENEMLRAKCDQRLEACEHQKAQAEGIWAQGTVIPVD